MEQAEINALAKKYGYLPEIIERFVKIFGENTTRKMILAYEKPQKITIRVNTLKITPQELYKRLSEKGFILSKINWYTEGFMVEKQPFAIGAATEYLLGFYFIQSIASWLPVLLLDPKPNELIFDLAAAPGGKTTHIAQKMLNDGTIICTDISRERMKALRSNLSRCGVLNTICIRMDAREIIKYNLFADKILLDAPCTGEGLMGIDKERRVSRDYNDIIRLAQLQKELFTAGVKKLRKDGIIVYSTCSTAPEENEEIIDWALSNFPLEILDTPYKEFNAGLTRAFSKEFHPSLNKAIRLYPHTDGTEGFFVCKLKLCESV